MTKVLINGAGGFIGSNLVKHFLKAGYSVRASDIEQADLSWAKALGAEICSASLTDASAIDASVKGVDIVIHTAAIFNLATPHDVIVKVNTEGTQHYCQASQNHKVKRLVMFSSTGVYGRPSYIPIRENGPKNPSSSYEISKWESEKIAMGFYKDQGLPVTVIRPTLVYGQGSKYGQSMYVGLFSSLKAWGQKTIPITRKGKINHHVHVDDVCSAVETLATADENDVLGKAFNVADNAPLTAEETVKVFAKLTGLKTRTLPSLLNFALVPFYKHGQELLKKPLSGVNRSMEKSWDEMVQNYALESALKPTFDIGWVDYLWADHAYNTKALKSLGWSPKYESFTTGMPKVIEWYREQGWIPTIDQLTEYSQTKQSSRKKRRRA